jgi:hypothetical protein
MESFKEWLKREQAYSEDIESYIGIYLANLMSWTTIATTIQAVAEASADIVRTVGETVRSPIRLASGHPKEAALKPLESAASGIWNLARNIGRFFTRPHSIAYGKQEVTEMAMESWQQTKSRLKLMMSVLEPDQREQAKEKILKAVKGIQAPEKEKRSAIIQLNQVMS